ncbi:hypothetical protein ACH4F6_01550 [Streptomyces sp. NPDC017936]|uniref:hypothetical protein n=1 Tax=Streptomyces sp. NPDC017936 TaxID=3365016 RepID=UPI00379E0B6D
MSHDDTAWTKVKPAGNGFVVRDPAAGRGVSLRAVVVDGQGNTPTQTIRNAYRGK